MKQNIATNLFSFKKFPVLTVAWLTAVFMSLFYNPYLSILIATLPSVYLLTSKITKVSLFSSNFFILSLSILIYVSFFQISLYLGWYIFPEISILSVALVTFIIIIAFLALFPQHRNEASKRNRKFINKIDFVALVGAILTLLFIAGIPLYKSIKLGAQNPLIHLMTYSGVDGSAHLSMLNDRLQFDRGILLNTRSESVARNQGGGYPIGWHSINSLFIKVFNPSIAPGIDSANVYVLTTLFWLFLLAYFLIRTSGALLVKVTETKLSTLSLTTLTSVSVLAIISFFGDFYTYGFYNYTPVLMVSILFIPSLIALYESKNSTDMLTFSILPLILLSLSAQSWLLVAPIFGIALFFIFIEKFKYSNNFSNHKPLQLSLFICLFLAITFSLIIQTVNTSNSETGELSTSFTSTILLDGGIAKYSIGFYIIITTLSGFYFIKSSKKSILPVILYLSSATIFIFFIYFIQQYKLQHNTYYYFKLLSIIIAIMWTIGITGVTAFIENLNIKSNITSLALGISVPIFIVFVFIPSLNIYNYVFNRSSERVNYSNQLGNILIQHHSIDNYDKKIITIYDPAGIPELNEIGSVFLKSNSPANTCYTILWSENFAKPFTAFNMIAPLSNNCQDFHINYIVNSDIINRANELIYSNGLSERVTIIPLE